MFSDPLIEFQPSRLNKSKNDKEEKCRSWEREDERPPVNLELSSKHKNHEYTLSYLNSKCYWQKCRDIWLAGMWMTSASIYWDIALEIMMNPITYKFLKLLFRWHFVISLCDSLQFHSVTVMTNYINKIMWDISNLE